MTISAEETNKAKEIIIRFKNAKYGSIKGYVKLNDFEILVNNETIDFLGLCAVTGMLSQECADYFINQIADTNAILLKSKTVVITPQFNAVSSRIEWAEEKPAEKPVCPR